MHKTPHSGSWSVSAPIRGEHLRGRDTEQGIDTQKNNPIYLPFPQNAYKLGLSRFVNFSKSTSEYYREVHWAPEVPNVKEFFKNIHSLPAGLSFKLTNQVATFTQLANSSTL